VALQTGVFFRGGHYNLKDREEKCKYGKQRRHTTFIGYLVLEAMDFLVDSKSTNIQTSAHDGKWIIDLYLMTRKVPAEIKMSKNIDTAKKPVMKPQESCCFFTAKKA